MKRPLHISFAKELLKGLKPSKIVEEKNNQLRVKVGRCISLLIFTKKGYFKEAMVFEPGRWEHCIAEGLTDNQAFDESLRYVDTFEDVRKFLTRQPYDWDGKKKWLKALKRT